MSLKIFLTAVAIVDDMGAVAIIALAYTAAIDWGALAAAAGTVALMIAANRRGVGSPWVYLIGFVLLWYCVLLSGVHATVAGVVAAACVPIRPSPGVPDDVRSPLHRLEHALDAPVLTASCRCSRSPMPGCRSPGSARRCLPSRWWWRSCSGCSWASRRG